jgi:hypothetical protein
MMIIAALLAFNLLVFNPELIGDSAYSVSQLINTPNSSYMIGLNPSGGTFSPTPMIWS